ncbi:dicarboxylate/amino acid:cation symporter [Fulvivirgaceae bacterium BMA10]|uniref:Dicarboxylate/amino acid:cation symporter n=1 Tax=Splendidivirga corallicola TaxID=3051826 RepID=A0ABT8KU48_9BACT|nr:dicarboxylate/amino acid:cation symporter [Fulvivirgaceae bacterium BMA10]
MIQLYTKLSFATRVLIWMFFGAILGIIFGKDILFIKPVGEIFIQLLIMAAIPLVFFNLLSGLTAIGTIQSFGKVGLKVIIYYVFSTAIAITIGITVMSFTKAGEGMALQGEIPENIGEMPALDQIIMEMVPTNIFKAFAEGKLIQIVVFAVLLGIVVLNLPKEKKKWFQEGFEKIAELMRKLVELILKASPLCLGALMAATFGEYGSNLVGTLTMFIVSVYLAQVIMVAAYMLVLRLVGRISPFWFLKKSSTLYATTIATCSSLASLAVSLDVAEKDLKLPKKIFSFTLPLGAQFNKDGTSIMLAGILIFTAQAVGLEFTIPQMIQIVIVGLLLSEGSTGIPGGGLIIAMLFAKAFNLPLEIVAIVGGIYRLIDMGNTTVNCMGDLVATSVISKLEDNWKPEKR